MLKKRQLPNFLWLVALLTTIMISYNRTQYSYQQGYYNGAYVGASYFMIHSDFPSENFLLEAVDQSREEVSKSMIEEVRKELSAKGKPVKDPENR